MYLKNEVEYWNLNKSFYFSETEYAIIMFLNEAILLMTEAVVSSKTNIACFENIKTKIK